MIPLLPPPGSAQVRSPPLAGLWLLPWQVALALAVDMPLPRVLDLGDGVQLLLGRARTLVDPQGRDAVPLAIASQSRQFVRIQPGAMVYPLPADRLAVLLGPDGRLDDFAAHVLLYLPPSAVLPQPPLSAWLNWLATPLGQLQPATSTAK